MASHKNCKQDNLKKIDIMVYKLHKNILHQWKNNNYFNISTWVNNWYVNHEQFIYSWVRSHNTNLLDII